ncbi:MAG: galactose ABC transporter substrate-binding protein [Clostridiales bacterium]|nr:galactose ABC transporter substrate-binding protein [Clostridiales bacterium]
MRRYGILALAAVFFLSGCGSRGENVVKSIKIGVTVYDQYDTFITGLMDSFTACAAQKEEETGVAINLEVMDAAGSQSTQNEQVQTLIERGCDIICVNLVDRTEPTTITDMAEKNDTPIIFFNRELVEEDLERWEKLYYVGADAFESGVMEGELAADAFLQSESADKNGDGICQYIVLEGEAGHQDSIVRTEYSINTMMEQGVEAEKLGYAIANWNRAQAQTKTASLYAQFGDEIEMILANNDDMALGAIDALKAAGVSEEDWPVIVGIDGTDVGLEAVQNGEMAGTVYNDKEGQALEMLKLAYALATDSGWEEVDLEDGKYIRLPYSKVTAENAGEFEDIRGESDS